MTLLSESAYQTFLAVAVSTMLLTPFLLQGGPALIDGLERLVPLDRLLPGLRPSALTAGEQPFTDHVIVAGYGLNGRNLTAALRSIDAPYLIVELNAQTVRQARSRGEPAFYGDATREEILRALGIDRARMLVAAISDPAATRRMVRVARGLNPGVHIIARTRYVVEIPELIRLGANDVIPEEFETSIEIFARVLAYYGVGRANPGLPLRGTPHQRRSRRARAPGYGRPDPAWLTSDRFESWLCCNTSVARVLRFCHVHTSHVTYVTRHGRPAPSLEPRQSPNKYRKYRKTGHSLASVRSLLLLTYCSKRH